MPKQIKNFHLQENGTMQIINELNNVLPNGSKAIELKRHSDGTHDVLIKIGDRSHLVDIAHCANRIHKLPTILYHIYGDYFINNHGELDDNGEYVLLTNNFEVKTIGIAKKILFDRNKLEPMGI